MRRRLIPGALFALLLAVPLGLQAQDRIQLGIEYRPGVRPGIMVAAGAGLDSVRKIVERDLQFSDRFEIAYWPDSAPPLSGPLNPALYGEVLPITWAVELQPAEGGVEVVLHHLPSSEERLRAVRHLDPAGEGSQRLAIHRVSDEVVRLTTGGQGIASTSILFSLGDAIWSIDSDGANMRQMSRGTGIAMGAVWSPDGSSFAYTEIRDYAGPVILQTIGTGARRTIPTTTGAGYNMTPAFSPDGAGHGRGPPGQTAPTPGRRSLGGASRRPPRLFPRRQHHRGTEEACQGNHRGTGALAARSLHGRDRVFGIQRGKPLQHRHPHSRGGGGRAALPRRSGHRGRFGPAERVGGNAAQGRRNFPSLRRSGFLTSVRRSEKVGPVGEGPLQSFFLAPFCDGSVIP